MNIDIQQFFAQIMRNKRGPESMSNLEELQQILGTLSSKISERAVSFVKTLFETQNIRSIQLLDWNYTISHPSQSPLCSKIMGGSEGGASFRCFECMQSNSSCICAECFQKGNHQGHNYVQYNSVNGCCDCGNSQAWNEKGFCPDHSSIKSSQCQIPASTRSLYLQEGQMLIYIYLYIYQKVPTRKGLLEQYGNQLFRHLTKISHENYEMKLLACQLMNSKFSEEYPFVPLREHSIIEIFFRLESDRTRAIPELINWIFETFPVEDMRRKTIKEYFELMKRTDELLTTDIPLGGLNFQYMSSVKQICKLIKNKQLEPFRAPFLKINQLDKTQITTIPLVFKKLYQDIDYISNMKSAKQYHILHLQVGSVAQMAAYREACKNVQPLPFDRNIAAIFNVDEMFLKSLYRFVRSAKEQKEILGKCLADLFHYIFNAGENLASMAQERAFAMIAMAYFDGDLDRLFKQEQREKLIKLMGVEKNHFGYMLEQIAKTTLQSTLNWLSQGESPKTAYQAYFLKTNMQKLLPQYLDKIFWKILILLSRDFFPFGEMIMQDIQAKSEKLLHEQIEIDDKTEKLNRSLRFGSLIMIAMNLAATVIRLDIDQTVINGLLGYLSKEKAFELFAKVVATFKQLNPKELKGSCLEIINNEELFEEFVTKYIIIDKGRFKLKHEVKPFEFLVYQGLFKVYSRPLPQTEVTYLTGLEEYPRFTNAKVQVYSPELISLAIEKCMEFISLLADQRNPVVEGLLNSLARQIFTLYLIDRKDEYRYFFRALLNPSLRIFFSKILIEQITMVQKEEQELAKDLEKIKNEEAEQFKAKREKVMQKKRMKEQLMKKNQEQMLSKFTKQIEEMKAKDQAGEICIYCKEETNEPLSMMSYIGLTNLIQKNILKHNLFHYFFSSCGHRIHHSCFLKANQKEPMNFCFLCKQQANILMPELGLGQKVQNAKQKANDFIGNILTAIINDNEIQNGKIGSFDNCIFEENMQILLTSLAKQFVYNGLHDYQYFKKKQYTLYLHLFQIIRLANKEEVSNSFGKMSQKWHKDEHEKNKLEYLQRAFELKMQEHFLGSETEQSLKGLKLQPIELQQVTTLLSSILNNNLEISITELKYINPDTLFVKVPSTLTELHQYMGKCKNCPNLTNNIFLCMVCGWSACIKCVKEIFKHVSQEHIDGAIILGCSTGRGIFEDISIYENYLGLSFSDADNYSEFGKSDKYTLNAEKQKQLRKMMLHYGVHQKVQLNSDVRVNYAY